eukprot:1860523-Pyramimonas_sp.AAC.1
MHQAHSRRASAVDVQREGPPPDEAWDEPLSPQADTASQVVGAPSPSLWEEAPVAPAQSVTGPQAPTVFGPRTSALRNRVGPDADSVSVQPGSERTPLPSVPEDGPAPE